MKKNDLEMAWNEPKDQQDPENKPRNPNSGGGAPDLDEIIDKLKKKFLGGSSNKSGGTGGTGGSLGGGLNERMMGKALLFVIPIALILWLATGIYIVDAGQKSVELLFGKYHSTKGPGLQWRLPNPIGDNKVIDVQRIFSTKIGGISDGDGALMLTKDEAIALVRVEVQYRIDENNAQDYWFASLSPDKTLNDVVESAIRERVGQTVLDGVLTKDRKKLTDDVKILAQSVLDTYKNGLKILNVNLEDAQPPEPVQKAFNDAIRAREVQQQRVNQGRKYAEILIAEIQGEIQREIIRAEGYHDSKIARATGEADRFTKLYNVYRLTPETIKERLYLEAMEDVLGKTSKIVMGSKNNNLMMLPLQEILKGNYGVQQEDAEKTDSVKKSDQNLNSMIIESPNNSPSAPISGRVRSRQ